MAKKTIFIASATESRELAATVAKALGKANYKPMRWWAEFPAGSITHNRLRELASEVDGAIFIFAGVDRTWYRGNQSIAPRDNVIFEYGMFSMTMGLQRALLVGESGVRLPTDLSGVNYLPLSVDNDSTAEDVVSHFDKIFSSANLPTRPDSLEIVVDPELISRQLSVHPPSDWRMRSYYIGLEGAKAWLTASSDPNYQSEEVKAGLRRETLGLVRGLETRTFVSLGPGDGLLDREIAIELRNHEPLLQYIPVDISNVLLEKAYELLAQQVQVPTGIVADFEDRLNFVLHHVRTRAPGPMLYGLMGNTFGNFDRSEGAFLNGLKVAMGSKDRILIEVALLKPGVTPKFPSLASDLSAGFRNFLACGASRLLGWNAHEVLREIDSFIGVEESADASDVADTLSMAYRDKKSKRVLALVRRYSAGSLREWLTQEVGLKIVDERIITSGAMIDRGLLLLGCK